MVKEIVKDQEVLNKMCEDLTRKDMQVVRDLVDTIKDLGEECACLAANQIGYTKRACVINFNGRVVVMINPKCVGHSQDGIECEEGCLSLEGVQKVNRYRTITVKYTDDKWKTKTAQYRGFEAECIQHMLDHFEGILI